MNRLRQCVLITTKDNKKFLVHKKHYKKLSKFIKTFNAECRLIKSKNKILELNELVPAICDKDYNQNIEELKFIKNLT